ncbi:DUF2505 family protein [Nannocystis sp.]|uniref:DUF2505 family protein n=1 Tax=Nannocystis sp. TaxID=1962667 RepID=UPI002421C779|nr:DUF2505 family protein [Nannocystis sp.]MBK7823923.1 DUF2505 family protein [Nannocystis sp.]MBK9754934.1 DUF2505 family protein [Nannocystis sp.]
MLHTIEHRFEVPADRLWQVFFFDDAYGDALAERLRLRVSESELQHEGAGPTLLVRRRRSLTPTRVLPAPLDRLMGAQRKITESGDFSAQRRRYTVTLELPAIGPRVRCDGEYTWETLADGGLRRVWQGRCEARIPVLGPTIERYLLGEIAANLAESHAFTCQWLREHAPRAATLL